MRRSGRSLWGQFFVGLSLLLPGVALAAEGAGSSPVYDLLLKFVNFGILAGILFYFLRKPVSQSLADRREDIRRELEDARQAKDAAEAKLKEYQERVSNLEQDVRRIQEDFRAEGQRQRERIVAEAVNAVEAMRRQTETAGANEVKRALDELRAEAADLAVQLAEEMLAKAYTAEDQRKAVKLTIENIEKVH